MAISRKIKEQRIAQAEEVLSRAVALVVFSRKRIDSASDRSLRENVRNAGGALFVAKNALMKRALDGTPFDSLSEVFKGVTVVAVAFSDDTVAAITKQVTQFVKGHAADEARVVAGGLSGVRLSVEEVSDLADLPSLDVLRSRLIGCINAPAAKIARVVQEPGAGLARVIQAKAKAG